MRTKYMAGQLPLVMTCILLLSYDTHFCYQVKEGKADVKVAQEAIAGMSFSFVCGLVQYVVEVCATQEAIAGMSFSLVWCLVQCSLVCATQEAIAGILYTYVGYPIYIYMQIHIYNTLYMVYCWHPLYKYICQPIYVYANTYMQGTLYIYMQIHIYNTPYIQRVLLAPSICIYANTYIQYT